MWKKEEKQSSNRVSSDDDCGGGGGCVGMVVVVVVELVVVAVVVVVLSSLPYLPPIGTKLSRMLSKTVESKAAKRMIQVLLTFLSHPPSLLTLVVPTYLPTTTHFG